LESQDRFALRRDRVRRAMQKAGADSLLVTHFVNVSYLTGFTGDDSYLLLGANNEVLLTDGRYTTQVAEECPGLDVAARRPGVGMLQMVSKAIRASRYTRLGVEGDSMTVGMYHRLVEGLPQAELQSTSGLVEHFRQRKDADEIEQIRQAVRYAEKAFAVLRAGLHPDKTEKQVADELEHQLRVFGARGCSFPTIVAAGPRAALPHARATPQRLEGNDLVLVDWGADGGQYKSDLTRVLVTGKISPKLERLYRVVLHAQQQAIAAVRPGAVAHDVDGVARRVIEEAGFGRYFGHGLGHGLGLEIHEAPRLAAKSQVVLQPGMVVTVEPGIYLPGWGGIRIEDDVLVTRTGHEVLTSVPKELDECVVD